MNLYGTALYVWMEGMCLTCSLAREIWLTDGLASSCGRTVSTTIAATATTAIVLLLLLLSRFLLGCLQGLDHTAGHFQRRLEGFSQLGIVLEGRLSPLQGSLDGGSLTGGL